MSADWHTIGDKSIYCRSKWEANYAQYLQWQKEKGYIQNWEHEPVTFWFEKIKRGVRSYLPDFRVTRKDGSTYWVEVKGYMDQRSATKIKRFAKYYPDEPLEVVKGDWFGKNNAKMRLLIKDWL